MVFGVFSFIKRVWGGIFIIFRGFWGFLGVFGQKEGFLGKKGGFLGFLGVLGEFCADFSSANLGEVLSRPPQAQRSEHNGKID